MQAGSQASQEYSLPFKINSKGRKEGIKLSPSEENMKQLTNESLLNIYSSQ
jgi:hypothetical protein